MYFSWIINHQRQLNHSNLAEMKRCLNKGGLSINWSCKHLYHPNQSDPWQRTRPFADLERSGKKGHKSEYSFIFSESCGINGMIVPNTHQNGVYFFHAAWMWMMYCMPYQLMIAHFCNQRKHKYSCSKEIHINSTYKCFEWPR